VKHYAAPDFWARYNELPVEVRQLADKAFKLLKSTPIIPHVTSREPADSGLLVWESNIGCWPYKFQAASFGFGSAITQSTTVSWAEPDETA
jgi:hypothetical protein